MPFRDRRDAGRRLAALLTHHRGTDAVVLALPRGGVPVGFEVAQALRVPLDVLLVRKLGVPYQPELGMGAIGEGGVVVLNRDLIKRLGILRDGVEEVAARERAELERRAHAYRGGRPAVPVLGRTAIVVDDGLATGFTARAAVQVVRAQGASRAVLAVPVAAPQSLAELESEVDELVCVEAPYGFLGVGQWYAEFRQTTDHEVIELLGTAGDAERPRETEAQVPAGSVSLPGTLTVPAGASGVVVFAHGSGSSRTSPRNVEVARVLQRAGLATVLFDLLTPAEAQDRQNVFDIPFLASRVAAAVRWLGSREDTRAMHVGLFGASTGGGAALWAAAEPGSPVAAVVSRGGRPDLAGPRLADVRAPTLLVVGERDTAVLELNERAARAMPAEVKLAVVAGATHLFEEPGTLEQVASMAASWLRDHLTAGAGRKAS